MQPINDANGSVGLSNNPNVGALTIHVANGPRAIPQATAHARAAIELEARFAAAVPAEEPQLRETCLAIPQGEPTSRVPSRELESDEGALATRWNELTSPANREEMYAVEAGERARRFPVTITPAHPSVALRARAPVRARHVQQVLAQMEVEASEFVWPTNPSPLYFEVIPEFPRFQAFEQVYRTHGITGVTLMRRGRELLAAYYARKCGFEIQFHNERPTATSSLASQLIVRGREQHGNDVRCAHYFGHDDAHGTVLLYVRQNGEEALIWLDSTQRADVTFATGLVEGCARLASSGKRIAVYQHVWSLQHDRHSCWLYAMAAARILTDRNLFPDLLKAFDERRADGPAPAGVVAVWALPELARMGQSLETISAHAGQDAERPLSGSADTLRTFVERFAIGLDGVLIPDFIRQKGNRAAETIDIEAYVDAQRWSKARKDEFAARMKSLVRTDVRTLDDNIEDLEKMLESPNPLLSYGERKAQFTKLAQTVHDEIQTEAAHLPETADLQRLIRLLSRRGLEELGMYVRTMNDRLTRFRASLDEGAGRFESEFTKFANLALSDRLKQVAEMKS